MGNTELLGKYEAMINELEDNGIYLTTIAYSIIDKHIKIEKKEYATECVKASQELIADKARFVVETPAGSNRCRTLSACYIADSDTDVYILKESITSFENIVLV